MARFASVSDDDVEKLLADKFAKNTSNSTTVAWNVFSSYLREREREEIDLKTCNKNELDIILKDFYASARKTDGSMYKMTTFRSLRAGIQRKIKETRHDLDIITGYEFSGSRRVYEAQCTEMKKLGLGKIDHKTPIPKADCDKMYSCGVLSDTNPTNLQYKFFFELFLHFCRRGRENLSKLMKTDFKVHTGENGVEEVVVDKDELTKNHGPNDAVHVGGVMQATNRPNCPVFTFKKYIGRLNKKNPYLFQRPKRLFPNENEGPWYDNQVVGVNTLSSYMKTISSKAELSNIYTNHCIRATAITVLDEAGVEARHIMSVSGQSIRRYCKTSVATKRSMSKTLSDFTDTSSSSSIVEHEQGCSTSIIEHEEGPSVAKKAKKNERSFAQRWPHKKTFDFGVNLDVSVGDDENDDENDENKQHTFNGTFTNCTFHIVQ